MGFLRAFTISVTVTSWLVHAVTSQKELPLQCCPLSPTFQQGGHLLCAHKGFRSFLWPRKANLSYDERLEELCLKGMADSSVKGVTNNLSANTLHKILLLDLSFNYLTSFPDLSHRLFTNLQHLNVSHNRISSLLADPFLRSLPKLQFLDLSWNQLSLLPDFAKSPLPDLVFLDLSHNSVQEMVGGRLQGLCKLQTLMVSHCQITSLDSFFHLSELKILTLRSNHLQTLPLGVFDDLGNLLQLDLSNNSLDTLPEKTFHGLKELTSLNLSLNQLGDLPSNSLHALASLHTLDLSSNRLESVSVGLFEGLDKLERLRIARNKVRAISPDTLKGLKNLEDLDLSYNQLTTIRKASFTRATKLLRLNLKTNPLKRLHEHVFAGLKWLEVLDLSHNKLQLDLQSLPEDLFSPLINLRTLSIHGNDFHTNTVNRVNIFTHLHNVSRLSLDMFSESVFSQDLSLLPRLRKLEVPNCNVTSLTQDMFKGLKESNLEQLQMYGCPLTVIEACAFCSLQKLERLTITHTTSTSFLQIPGKPFTQNSPLRHLNLSAMRLHSDTVQALADHTLKNLDWLQVLDLSGNQLTNCNLSLPKRLEELHLSGNRFQTLPVNLSALNRLTLLDVMDNNVSFLTSSEQTAIEATADTSLTFILRLQGNQLSCPETDCTLKTDFWLWMISTTMTLDDGSLSGGDYPCVTEHGTVRTVGEALERCASSWWWSGFSGSVRLLIVTAVMGCAVMGLCLVKVFNNPGRANCVVRCGTVLQAEDEDEDGVEGDEEEAEEDVQEYDQVPGSSTTKGHNSDSSLISTRSLTDFGCSDVPSIPSLSLTVKPSSFLPPFSSKDTFLTSTNSEFLPEKERKRNRNTEEQEFTIKHKDDSRLTKKCTTGNSGGNGQKLRKSMTMGRGDRRARIREFQEHNTATQRGSSSCFGEFQFQPDNNTSCSYVQNYNQRHETERKMPIVVEQTESSDGLFNQTGMKTRGLQNSNAAFFAGTEAGATRPAFANVSLNAARVGGPGLGENTNLPALSAGRDAQALTTTTRPTSANVSRVNAQGLVDNTDAALPLNANALANPPGQHAYGLQDLFPPPYTPPPTYSSQPPPSVVRNARRLQDEQEELRD